MRRRSLLGPAPLTLATLLMLVAAAPALAQVPDAQDWLDRCRSGWNDRDSREQVCDVREIRLPADGRLAVDGRSNGSIRVEAWDRSEVLVQALISATARTLDDARGRVDAVEILSDGGRVRAEGPRVTGNGGWSVSYRVWVPRATDLDLRASNGGLRVEGVQGRLELQTTNGGITLTDVAGDVRGRTTNGSVTVRLAGSRWAGSGLDVRTTNGGVTLHVPETYSARVETGTVNGRTSLDFPVMVQGRMDRNLAFDLGQGGAPIRVRTTNGGVRIRQL